MEELQVISVLCEKDPGVICRLLGLLSHRGVSIEALSLADTMEQRLSMITIVTRAKRPEGDQLRKELTKLINVVRVTSHSGREVHGMELALIKLEAGATKRDELLRLLETFGARVLEISPDELTVEVSGKKTTIDALIGLLEPYGIMDIARSGPISLAYRSKKIPKRRRP